MRRRGVLRAPIFEVFSSLQGEGVRLGERQLFVRFGGCNLRCDYCDEPGTIPLDSGEEWEAERLRAVILAQTRGRRHRAVAWTGGEPLLYPEFLLRILPWTRECGFENYLETNGMHVGALRKLLPWLDTAAVDLKLPSAVGRHLWNAHADFIKAARRIAFVKVVLTHETKDAEMRRVILLMLETAPEMPLILQPATAGVYEGGGKVLSVEPERAIKFLIWARARLKDVRLIPQWHPLWRLK